MKITTLFHKLRARHNGPGRGRRLLMLVAALALSAILWLVFSPDFFWSHPWAFDASFNGLADKVESASSADGEFVVIARDDPERGSELYSLARKDGVWGDAVALRFINSPFNETDPDVSADGNYLFFASDRPGGLGGFDLWVARRMEDTWGPPINLGPEINSRFDEQGPSAPLSTDLMVFASNRPDTPLTDEDDLVTGKELRRKYIDRDMNLYYAKWEGFRKGKRPTSYALRDHRQLDETLIERLGGSAGTEAAVLRALDWISSQQEPDGRWVNQKHRGQGGHDAGATAISLLCLLGRGFTHVESSPYQESVAKGLIWLQGAMKADGDLRNNNTANGMYDQGMATMALAEAYGLSEDEGLREPLQRAVDFIVRAQNKQDGGWRYTPGQAGDTSVFGWQVMALHSARSLGLSVPEDTVAGAKRWLGKVSGGRAQGLYGYDNNSHRATMTAEGMFCSQLLGFPRGDSRMNESAEYLHRMGFEPSGEAYYYYIYYSTLSLYHYHGDTWNTWNRMLKEKLLVSQIKQGNEKGTWAPAGQHAAQMGTLMSTAMATLALEVYYRYLPRYEFLHPIEDPTLVLSDKPDLSGLPPHPVERERSNTVSEAVLELALTIPAFEEAKSLLRLNTESAEAQPALSQDGATLVFASNRKGSRGGADLFVSRLKRGKFTRAKRLFGHPNSIADETDPVLYGQGEHLRFSSNRESPSGQWYRLYEAERQPFSPFRALLEALAYIIAVLARVKGWLLAALLAAIAIIYLLRQITNVESRRKLTLLQHCLLASLLLHLFGLVLAAFYKISSEVTVVMKENTIAVAVDVNALAQEKLALDIREDITELPETQDTVALNQADVQTPDDQLAEQQPIANDVETDAITEAFQLDVVAPVPEVVLARLDVPLPESLESPPPFEAMEVEMPMEERAEETQEAEQKVSEMTASLQTSLPVETLADTEHETEIPTVKDVPQDEPGELDLNRDVVEATKPDVMPELAALESAVQQKMPPVEMEEREAEESSEAPAQEMLSAGKRAQKAGAKARITPVDTEPASLLKDDPPASSVEQALLHDKETPEEAHEESTLPEITRAATNMSFVVTHVQMQMEEIRPAAETKTQAVPDVEAGHLAKSATWETLEPADLPGEYSARPTAEIDLPSTAEVAIDAPRAPHESAETEKRLPNTEIVEMARASAYDPGMEMESAAFRAAKSSESAEQDPSAAMAHARQALPEAPHASEFDAVVSGSQRDVDTDSQSDSAPIQNAAGSAVVEAETTPEDLKSVPAGTRVALVSSFVQSAVNLPAESRASVVAGNSEKDIPQTGAGTRQAQGRSESSVETGQAMKAQTSVDTRVTQASEAAPLHASPVEATVASESLAALAQGLSELARPRAFISTGLPDITMAEPQTRKASPGTSMTVDSRPSHVAQATLATVSASQEGPVGARASHVPLETGELHVAAVAAATATKASEALVVGSHSLPAVSSPSERAGRPGTAPTLALETRDVSNVAATRTSVTTPRTSGLRHIARDARGGRVAGMDRPVSDAAVMVEQGSGAEPGSVLAATATAATEALVVGSHSLPAVSSPSERAGRPGTASTLALETRDVSNVAATRTSVTTPRTSGLRHIARDERGGQMTGVDDPVSEAVIMPEQGSGAIVGSVLVAMHVDTRESVTSEARARLAFNLKPSSAAWTSAGLSLETDRPASAPFPRSERLGREMKPGHVSSILTYQASPTGPERTSLSPSQVDVGSLAYVDRPFTLKSPMGESVASPRVGRIGFKQGPLPQPALPPDLKMDEEPESLSPYVLRKSSDRPDVLQRTGGDSSTEQAVVNALTWLSGAQEPDGHWSIARHGGEAGHDAGATGLALLAYLGWGATHTGDSPYRDNVARALDWLLARIGDDGDLRDEQDDNAMYSQAIATLALTEAFALTHDAKLKKAAQAAIDFVVDAQNPDDGGWRYYPQEPGDTSVFGWQITALMSARIAGLKVPEKTIKKSALWLDRVGGGRHGGLYGYRDRNPLQSIVAVGLFSRQLMGAARNDPKTLESIDYLRGSKLDVLNDQLPVYYQTYYTTLALYQHQGPEWLDWNAQLKSVLVGVQEKDGPHAGSWPARGLYGKRSGRVVSTAMAALSLQVYYRYLPIYSAISIDPDALP